MISHHTWNHSNSESASFFFFFNYPIGARRSAYFNRIYFAPISVCFHDSRYMRSYGMHSIIRLSKADGKEKSGTDGIKEWKWLFKHCYTRALSFLTFPRDLHSKASIESENLLSPRIRSFIWILSLQKGRCFNNEWNWNVWIISQIVSWKGKALWIMLWNA